MRMFVCCVAFLVFINPTLPQFCSGGISEPIINTTFGTVSKPFPKITSLKYSQGCPAKGEYTIKNLSFLCGERTWLMLAGDHTRDVNGQYMLVNGSDQDETIFIDTVKGLCPNLSYQFTAWITNVMQTFSCAGNPVLPELIFSIEALDKTILQTYTTGNIPLTDEKKFIQYGLNFKLTGSTSEAIFKIKTKSKPGCGGAFAIDDIFLNYCGPLAEATLDGSKEARNVCADYKDPFELKAFFGAGFANPEMQWQQSIDSGKSWTNIPGATTISYNIPRRVSGGVSYRYVVAEKGFVNSISCRVVSNSIFTDIHPVPPHKAPQNLIGCINQNLQLPETDAKALSILWTGPNNYSSNLPQTTLSNVQSADAGVYQLKQNFHFGCTSLDTFNIGVFPGTFISVKDVYGICEGESVRLEAKGPGSFKWSPADFLSSDISPNPFANPKDSIAYKVIVTNEFGCKDSASVMVNVFKKPTVYAGPDLSIEIGDTVTLNQATFKGTDIGLKWTPDFSLDDSRILNPRIFPKEDIVYTLTGTSNLGCGTAVDAIKVTVFQGVYVPTAFTPNGDGINDVFKIYGGGGYQLKKFIIYNRWGEQVFTSKNISFEWSGLMNNKPLAHDTYVYYMELLKNAKTTVRKGTIILIK